MRLFKAIREQMKEPVIKLLSYLILLIIFSGSVNISVNYYITNHYKKPFEMQIANQESKKHLADILKEKLQSVFSIHKTILLTSNNKQIKVLSEDLNTLLKDADSVLTVLKDGGTFVNKYLVNFYDKDEIREEIVYEKSENKEIPVDVINLSPMLSELQKLLNKATELILKQTGLEITIPDYDYQVTLIIKQAEALLIRTRESANKINFDIYQANKASKESIIKIQANAEIMVLLMHIIIAVFLVFFTIVISYKISVIIKAEKLLKNQNFELEQEQEHLKLILNGIQVGIIIIGKDKIIKWLNNFALEMIGGNHIDNFLDIKCYDFMECDEEYKLDCPHMDRGLPLENEESFLKNGNNKSLSILKSSRNITWNNENSLLVSFFDISKRRKTELALENTNKELISSLEKVKDMQDRLIQSEKMASIGQLAAGVAHEINNPTGYITTNLVTMTEYVQVFKKVYTQLEILKESIAEKNDTTLTSSIEILDKIEKEEDLSYIIDDSFLLLSESSDGARRIKKIVNGLRDFARKDSISLNEGNLNNSIEDALRLTMNELKYNCKIFKELEDIPNILCHEDQLTQVFMNLFVNASHSITDQGEINIKTWEDNGFIIATVCDTGIGILEEDITKLFDPFFTTKEVGKGTGLGLSISYGIIKDHGGTIEVESTVGKGSCFTIRLPVSFQGS